MQFDDDETKTEFRKIARSHQAAWESTSNSWTQFSLSRL